MNRTSTVLTVAAVSTAGILAYAAYFDYKRRNDAAFRKKLRSCPLFATSSHSLNHVFITSPGKEKKKISKTVAQSADLTKPAGGSIEEAMPVMGVERGRMQSCVTLDIVNSGREKGN